MTTGRPRATQPVPTGPQDSPDETVIPMMGGGSPGMAAITMLTLLLIAVGVAWYVGRNSEPLDTVAPILDERLANGELTPEQYHALQNTLTRTRPLQQPSPARRPVALVVVLALVAVATIGVAAGTGGRRWPGLMRSMHNQMWGAGGANASPAPSPVAGAREIQVVAAEFFFEPTDIRVRPGETVNVVLDNRGTLSHDLFIRGLDWELEADRHDQATGALTAPAQAEILAWMLSPNRPLMATPC